MRKSEDYIPLWMRPKILPCVTQDLARRQEDTDPPKYTKCGLLERKCLNQYHRGACNSNSREFKQKFIVGFKAFMKSRYTTSVLWQYQ